MIAELGELGRWPELMRLGTAAEFLNMAPQTFGPLAYILAAHHGLKLHHLCGVRIRRQNLLEGLDGLRLDGLAGSFDKRADVVRIGETEHRVRRQSRGKRKGVRNVSHPKQRASEAGE